jgi:hypothetical protein
MYLIVVLGIQIAVAEDGAGKVFILSLSMQVLCGRVELE